jgi:hypothetical protein
LLEGVAVAGLVGIVRQLGDLAEFAAEIFHDLHEQLRTLRVRGDGLTSRLLRLETELPAVEKALRTSTDQFRYAYIAGAQWHPSSRTDQNHCTKLDLPNFIHNYYENCHGPPRLFLLDKYCLSKFFPAYTSNKFGYNQRISGLAFKNVPSFFRGSTIKILRV